MINIDTGKITVSGISAGAQMAHQLHIASHNLQRKSNPLAVTASLATRNRWLMILSGYSMAPGIRRLQLN
jgi:poly(3-hydroxybutyrate) depolymerase